MQFCCLCCNVENSCHKHFVVISCHQQTLPLTTSDQCHNLPWSSGTVLITPSRSQRWQHTLEPDIGSEFLPTPPAFVAPVRGVPVGILPYCLVWKNENGLATQRCKNFEDMFILFDKCMNMTDGHRDTAWRHRLRLHSIAQTSVYQVCFRNSLAC